MTIDQARKKYIFLLFCIIVAVVMLVYIILNIIQVNDNIFLSGTIRSKNTVIIKSPCNLFIQELLVSPGEEIKKGQKLAYIDDISIREYIQELQTNIIDTQNKIIDIEIQRDIYQHQVAILEESAEQAKITMQNAEDVYNANLELYELESISITDLRNFKFAFLQAKTNYLTLQKNLIIYKIQNKENTNLERIKKTIELEELKLQTFHKQLNNVNNHFIYENTEMGNPYIISPNDGIVSAIGDVATQNAVSSDGINTKINTTYEKDNTIFEIVNPDNVYIDCNIIETNFPYIYPDDQVFITIPAYPVDDYGILMGIIDKLYKEPSSINGTTQYKCEIKFSNLTSNKKIKTYLGLSTRGMLNVKRSFSLFRYLINRIFLQEPA